LWLEDRTIVGLDLIDQCGKRHIARWARAQLRNLQGLFLKGGHCYDPNIPRDQAGSKMPPMAPHARPLSEAAAFPFSCYTADNSDICIHVFRCFITSLISLNIVVVIFPLITCS
jgi:hypothetical protein